MKSEKWVVVELCPGSGGYDAGVDDVHGIFESENEAREWAYNRYGSYEVRRIRKAVTDEWA